MKKTSLIIIAIIVLIVVGIGAFYGGMLYGKSQSKTTASSSFQTFRGARTGASGASIILGDIIGEDSTSITLQLPNGSGSKIIFYSDTTQISKTTTGAASDLTNGTSVNVTGIANADGSVTANSIQIRPAGQVRPTTSPAQ